MRTARSKSPRPATLRGGAGFGADELRALGRELRRLRISRDWSLKRMATESGVSVAAIQKIESGGTNPSLLTVLSLAEALGQPLDDLVAASRKALKVVALVQGGLARRPDTVSDLSLPMTDRNMSAKLIALSPNAELSDLEFDGPIFAYLLEGSVALTFDGDRVERLRANDAIHLLDVFPKRVSNLIARRSLLLCLSDLRGAPTNA